MAANIFHDIATRTSGDIYIGVVGPVRAGKSTFITRFMERQIVPRIKDEHEQTRVIDELPQAGDGAGIMTTQPRFVPRDGVNLKIGAASMRVRMVDCVGYIIPGSVGHEVDGKPRMVKTPWSDTEMSFEKAAEFGTRKVIKDHSTIAVVMTTDGSVTGLPRENYVEAEEKVIAQLKKLGKPFVIIVNSRTPMSAEAQRVATEIRTKHAVTTLAVNADTLDAAEITTIFNALIAEFPVIGFRVTMPKWLTVLDPEHEIISEAITALKTHTSKVKKLIDNDTTKIFEKSSNFMRLETTNIDAATGMVTLNVVAREDLYFRVLSSASGKDLNNEAHLVAFLFHSSKINREYTKIHSALTQAKEEGYGIVQPAFEDFTLMRPELHRSGKNFGLKFRATAPSLHMVRVDVNADVTPSIGSRAQSEAMLAELLANYDADPNTVWPVPIFGKSLESIVQEGIHGKVVAMPPNAKAKMKRTLTKIVNNGRGGIICILL